MYTNAVMVNLFSMTETSVYLIPYNNTWQITLTVVRACSPLPVSEIWEAHTQTLEVIIQPKTLRTEQNLEKQTASVSRGMLQLIFGNKENF